MSFGLSIYNIKSLIDTMLISYIDEVKLLSDTKTLPQMSRNFKCHSK